MVPMLGGWYGEGGVDAAVGVDARPGYLRISAPSGNDLFPNTNLDAPTSSGSSTVTSRIETRLEFAPAEDYQGAGLLIWQDEENFVRLERCFGGIGGKGSGICFLKIAGGEIDLGRRHAAGRDDAPRRVELRLQRAGKRVSAWWRDASGATVGAWQSVGSSEIDLPGGEQPGATSALRAGVLLCVEGAEEIGADFDLFRLWGQ